MLDVTQYEEVQVEMPNIIFFWNKNDDLAGRKFELHHNLRPFALAAAKKFPMWRFVAGDSKAYGGVSWGSEVVRIGRLTVLDGKESIGQISWEWGGRGHSEFVNYTVTNERISNQRERGSHARTRHMGKALKIMEKSFGAKTIAERLHEARTQGLYHLSRAEQEKRDEFRYPYQELTLKLVEHFMQDWESVKAVGVKAGIALTLLESLPSKYEDFKIANEVLKCVSQGKGVVVTIHGSDYAVRKLAKSSTGEDHPMQILSTENLPEHIKRGVGMLKLVEKNHIIGGVGYKIDDASFFVIDKEA